MKLNQVLAATESESPIVKTLISEYSKFFSNSQGAFKGEKKTYETVPGYLDNPANRSNKAVVTTVDEKIDYFYDVVIPSLKKQFSLEATNASNTVRAELIVDNKVWGEFTSLELLRLKSFVSSPKLVEMLNNIPVRSDAKEWAPASDEQYTGRYVVQGPSIVYEEKTTEKEEVILVDPNIERAIAAGKEINYTPQTTVRTKQVTIGSGTLTHFSGEWTQTAKANALKRLSVLKAAVIDALQRANQAEAIESELDPGHLLNFIFGR